MYVDTDIFYALIKKGDRHLDIASATLQKKEAKYTSVLTLLELEILIKREIDNGLSKQTHEIFKQRFPEVRIFPLNEKTHKKSQELRKKFDVGIFDAVHASTDSVYDRISGLKRIEIVER